MSKPLYIFGAGGLGREVRALVMSLPEWKLAGFYDDGLKSGSNCEDVPCYGGLQDLLKQNDDIFIVIAIGDPVLKSRVAEALRDNKRIHFPTLIHPRATLLDPSNIQLGSGCIITAGVVLTTRIILGRHVLLNLNATVGHDISIGNYCSIMPGANLAGGVTVQNEVLIGSGAIILNSVELQHNVRVGAGAVVTQSVTHNRTVVGVPAKDIKKL